MVVVAEAHGTLSPERLAALRELLESVAGLPAVPFTRRLDFLPARGTVFDAVALSSSDLFPSRSLASTQPVSFSAKIFTAEGSARDHSTLDAARIPGVDAGGAGEEDRLFAS